ncbi:acetylornithine deacetylase [Acidicapsa acidisoli]|uniref:acetylornithine deacetylase n=1 Tax=Acidicapsa acidisoli TaxID=1615681 RepID=UPI0021E006E9|nr:acetylornithine deacetylase [Acidicapsa acidisoli]
MNSFVSAAEILRELIAIPTPSAVSNLPLLEWVRRFLEPRGWRVELLPYEDESGVAKANMIAWQGSSERSERIDLAFVCHTDTVPYAETWKDPLSLQEREGRLHGCGSCDVKGSLACFLAAVSDRDRNAIRTSIALILTADEEIGCKGMERLLAATNLRIGSAIVSEPTSLRAGIAGKGYGLARITVDGREAHSAFPQQGVSAISVAARMIARIEDTFANRVSDAPTDALFDPPRTTLNIGTIEGGSAKNIIPGRCSFLVEWRAIPDENPVDTLRQLRGLLVEAHAAEPRAVFRLENLRAEPGFSPAARGRLQSRLAGLLPGEPVGISFGSEASRVARIADEVIVIGPGDMRSAHSERECVPIAELELWTSVLRRIL